jgi:hypothetical protein
VDQYWSNFLLPIATSLVVSTVALALRRPRQRLRWPILALTVFVPGVVAFILNDGHASLLFSLALLGIPTSLVFGVLYCFSVVTGLFQGFVLALGLWWTTYTSLVFASNGPMW